MHERYFRRSPIRPGTIEQPSSLLDKFVWTRWLLFRTERATEICIHEHLRATKKNQFSADTENSHVTSFFASNGQPDFGTISADYQIDLWTQPFRSMRIKSPKSASGFRIEHRQLRSFGSSSTIDGVVQYLTGNTFCAVNSDKNWFESARRFFGLKRVMTWWNDSWNQLNTYRTLGFVRSASKEYTTTGNIGRAKNSRWFNRFGKVDYGDLTAADKIYRRLLWRDSDDNVDIGQYMLSIVRIDSQTNWQFSSKKNKIEQTQLKNKKSGVRACVCVRVQSDLLRERERKKRAAYQNRIDSRGPSKYSGIFGGLDRNIVDYTVRLNGTNKQTKTGQNEN